MIHTFESDGIRLTFGRRRVLSAIYFKCQTGKITGILGRNDQGKTCLMNVVYGTLEAQSKSVRFDRISVHSAFKKPALLTYLPQFNFIPPDLSLKRIFADFNLSYADFQQTFPEFGPKHHAKIKQLSGGQRRLVEVYVIVKAKSWFSMLDEPFSHLMPLHIEQLKGILQIEKAHKGFLITDHMFRQVTGLCDELYVLSEGKTHRAETMADLNRLGYV